MLRMIKALPLPDGWELVREGNLTAQKLSGQDKCHQRSFVGDCKRIKEVTGTARKNRDATQKTAWRSEFELIEQPVYNLAES